MSGTYNNPIIIDAEPGSANNPIYIHDSDSETTVSINYSAHAQDPFDFTPDLDDYAIDNIPYENYDSCDTLSQVSFSN